MSDDRDDDFRDEKTRVAASLDRTVVRAKSTLNDAFSEKTTVFIKTEPLPNPPPLEEYPESAPGGAKRIRAADAALDEDSQLEIEPAPKKEKKKKQKTEGPAFKFNFPKVEPKVAVSLFGALAVVALVVWFVTSEPTPSGDVPDVADIEATPMEKEDLASLPDNPPPQPKAPVVEMDTSTARALENFDMAVRRTQDRARQKVE